MGSIFLRGPNLKQRGGIMPGQIGEVAPEFKLPSADGDVSLSDFKGKSIVVLSFHVFDFTAG